MVGERDLLRVVAEDLQHLRDVWLLGELQLPSLRRDSVMLRRLIGSDGTLKQAWFIAIGKAEFVVPTWKLEDVLKPLPKARTLVASIGGGAFQGGEYGALAVVRGRSPFQLPKPDELPLHSLSLKAFCKGDCMDIEGQRVSRVELIEYFANRLGGAHVGQRGDARAWRALDKVLRYTAASEDVRQSIAKGGQPLFFVEFTHGGETFKLDPLHAELLALGQWLAKSAHIDQLLRIIAN